MVESLLPGLVRGLAQWMDHSLVVCTLVGGAAMAVALVDRSKEGDTPVDSKETDGRLRTAAVSMFCAVFAAMLFQFATGFADAVSSYVARRSGANEATASLTVDQWLSGSGIWLTGLWAINLLAMTLGGHRMLQALGVSLSMGGSELKWLTLTCGTGITLVLSVLFFIMAMVAA